MKTWELSQFVYRKILNSVKIFLVSLNSTLSQEVRKITYKFFIWCYYYFFSRSDNKKLLAPARDPEFRPSPPPQKNRHSLPVAEGITLQILQILGLTGGGNNTSEEREPDPRIPAHPITSGALHPGLASATVINRLINRVKREAPKVQNSLVSINTREITNP